MPRARNIKPGFFRNELLVELNFETRLLFIGLWTLADKAGRLEDRPLKIKIELFPADPLDVSSMLHALTMHGFITRYTVDGKKYIQIDKFLKHQRPHHKEQESSLPPLSKEDKDEGKNKKETKGCAYLDDTQFMDESSTVQEEPKKELLAPLIPDTGYLIPDTRENNGPSGDEPARNKKSPSNKFTESEFEEFWKTCRENWHGVTGTKIEAKKEFLKLSHSSEDLTEITRLTLVECQARKRQNNAEGFAENMKHVCRWLKYRGWESVADRPRPSASSHKPWLHDSSQGSDAERYAILQEVLRGAS